MPALAARGHHVWRAVRRPPKRADEVRWDPESGELGPLHEAARPETVVYVAGVTLAGLWTRKRKREAWTSRVDATGRLAEFLARHGPPPRFVSASAVDYYGDRGDEWLTEDSAPGQGFLAEMVSAWERAADPLARRGGEVAHVRLGLVLSARAGALLPVLIATRLGFGGPLGNGRQFWSWITLEDAVRALVHVLERSGSQGVWNAVVPEPVRQVEFVRALGRVLHRPTFFPAPEFAMRLFLGEMASLPLASHRVRPERLLAERFTFAHPTLDEALRNVLRSSAAASRREPAV